MPGRLLLLMDCFWLGSNIKYRSYKNKESDYGSKKRLSDYLKKELEVPYH